MTETTQPSDEELYLFGFRALADVKALVAQLRVKGVLSVEDEKAITLDSNKMYDGWTKRKPDQS